MTSYNNKSMTLSLFLIVMFFWGHECSGHERMSTTSLKVDNHYKDVKSHVIKTFEDDAGDIIDCIYIYQQPALSHPLLKNHQIQLKPGSVPKPSAMENSKNISFSLFHKMPECPNEYVPIKRESSRDLMTTKHLNYMTSSKDSNPAAINYFDAVIEYQEKHNGARAYINVWGIANMLKDQTSMASITLQDGPPYEKNTIMAGWMVQSDSRTRLFTYWRVNGDNGSSCLNSMCRGFVQVSPKIHPGALLQPLSIYDGKQYEMGVQIFQDAESGHWLLTVLDTLVGYWPKSLFTYFQDGANYASWGGHVTSPLNIPSPPMGSSTKPRYINKRKVAYVRHIEVNIFDSYVDPESTTKFLTGASCYDVQDLEDGHAYFGHNAPFGGPGGCTF